MNRICIFSRIGALALILSITVAAGTLFAGGQPETTATQIQMQPQPRQYLAPANPDSGHTSLSLPFSSVTVPGTNRVIKSWTFTVFDSTGAAVYIDTKAETRTRGAIANLFNIGTKPQVEIPSELAWDGTYKNGGGDDGKVVPDGDYIYQIYITDDQGAVARTPPFNVTVDDTAPTISTLSSPQLIFSPKGGRKSVQIDQAGSREVDWKGAIMSSDGTVVKNFEWKNDTSSLQNDAAPPTFTWDGTDDSGQLLPEGDYTYELTGTDRAGNTTTKTMDGTIVLSLRTSQVVVTEDRDIFSPGTNSLTLKPDVTNVQNMVSWRLSVNDKGDTNSIRWFTEGKAQIPAQFVYAGKDLSGRTLPEGQYDVRLTVTYNDGNVAQSDPLYFTVDTTPPTGLVSAETVPGATESGQPIVFGGTGKTGVKIQLNSSTTEDWAGAIVAPDGTKLTAPLSDFGITQLPYTFTWDGTDPTGKLAAAGQRLPDGTYTLYMYATDAAGNYGESNKVKITLDTSSPTIKLAASSSIFAPNTSNGTVTYTPTLSSSDRIDQFLLYVKDSAGKVVRAVQVRQPFSTFVWDGRSTSNQVVPDGSYTAELTVVYQNGNAPTGTAPPVVVDTTAPSGTLAASAKAFGGNGKPNVTFTLSSASAAEWTIVFVADSGDRTEIPVGVATGGTVSYTWDGHAAANGTTGGTAAKGGLMADGLYTIYATAVDPAGNKGETNQLIIRKDTRTTPVSITLSGNLVSPGVASRPQSVRIIPVLAVTDGVSSFELDIKDASGSVVRSRKTAQAISYFDWDGHSDQGKTVPDGSYNASLTVAYDAGNISTATSDPITVNTTVTKTEPPIISYQIQHLPFSPDGDGNNDTLTASLSAQGVSAPVASWNIQILDPAGNTFFQVGGNGAPPANVSWNGKNNQGELVQSAMDYTAVFTVTDQAGNTAEKRATIPIDILVMKEGDQYRIIIPSIQFDPYSSDLFAVQDPSMFEKNLETLRRLATILQKYPGYQIAIEGNAVHVFWQPGPEKDAEQTDVLIPLSKARAETVKNALTLLGVDRNRMTTVGNGGADPVVPENDFANLWKNRRVEFVLVKR